MDISIVIPVLNESEKITGDILAGSQFIIQQHYTGEIIIIDDGSADDTAEIARDTPVPDNVSLNVIRYTPHRGKGYAVRTGITNSTGKIVLFIDSGNCVPYENILPGIIKIQNGECDLAHGSRKLPESIIKKPHNLSRRITSFLFRVLLKVIFRLPSYLTDTQCGLKIYSGDIGRRLYLDCFTEGFMFDIEIIVRALKANYRIKEFPIQWSADPDSRLSLSHTPFDIIDELRNIKKRL
ncbi:glycosyltransferase [candidate division KSB1 bacterium]|nr:glycosyltransferase [candidate division KSB1 bacterium]